MTTYHLGTDAWVVVRNDEGGVLGVFPELPRADWFADQCKMFAATAPSLYGVDVDIETICDAPERWVHDSKRQPLDAEALQVRLSYAERLLRAVADCPTPRFTEGIEQQRLDSAHACARAYVEKHL